MWFCNTAAGFFVAIYMYEMLVRIHYPLSMFQRLAPGHLRYPLAFIHEQKGLFFTEVSVAGGIIYSDKADLFGFCLESKEPASLFFSFCSICMNREQKGKVGGGGSLKTIIYVLILYLTSGQLASRVQYHKSNLSNTMWRCWHLIIVFLSRFAPSSEQLKPTLSYIVQVWVFLKYNPMIEAFWLNFVLSLLSCLYIVGHKHAAMRNMLMVSYSDPSGGEDKENLILIV